MQFLFQANQNKIIHCQNYTAITYRGFSTVKMTKLPTVTNRPNCYFLKQCKHTKFINIKQTISHDITNIEDVEDIVSNDVDICDLDEAKLSSNRLRGVLYPESNDSIINKLKLCLTVQEVFDIVIENEQYFNHEHCSQAIVVLWDLQKLYEIAESSGDSLLERVILQETELLKTYQANLNQHPSFNRLLYLTSITYKEMSPDALSCSFLYLRKMGVSQNNCLVQDLILQLEHLLATVEPLQFPLTALSRFSVGIFYDKDLRASLTLIKILPHVISNLGKYHIVCIFNSLVLI